MTPCDHLIPDNYPLVVDLVIDEHLGFADALVSCSDCGQPYLLEMLDWRGSERLYRMSMPSREHCARLIRDLTRGSCDINRAGEEVRHLQSQQPWLETLLWLDTSMSVIRGLVHVGNVPLPGAGWRELPCDGSWFDQLRTNTVIENG